jgi:hypothetical protein
VHPPAAEPGHLTRREQPRHQPGRRPGSGAVLEHPAGQVGLQAAQRLAGQDVEPHGDQRARLGVEDLVRRGGASTKGSLHFPVDEPLAEALVKKLLAVRMAEAFDNR